MKLTPRESDVLSVVSIYADVHGRPPMQDHIAAAVGHASRARVQQILKQLETKGFVRLGYAKIRGVQVVRQEASAA